MKSSEALSKAKKKWEEGSVEHITLRVPKGKRELVQKCAEVNNESVNQMINRLLNAEIRRKLSDRQNPTK